MKTHRFCVVVPAFNSVEGELYLRTLDSVFMQDYANYHMVYIDDASTDNTSKYI